jgi:hypothetical protein
MAGSATDYLENKIVDHFFTGKTSTTKPSVWLALYTVTPTDSAAGTEATGGAYARVATAGTDWNAASGGVATNATVLTFPTPTAGWGTIVAIAGVDAVSAGNILWYSDQTPNKTVNTGDTVSFPIGSITITQT